MRLCSGSPYKWEEKGNRLASKDETQIEGISIRKTYFIKSKPCSSSGSSAGSADSRRPSFCGRDGLLGGDLPSVGGLLLRGGASLATLEGLTS